MKNYIKFSTLILLCGVLTLSSCSDDDDEPTPTPPPTATQKISGKDFVLTDFNSQINDEDFITFADLDDCDKDDILRFNSDGTGKEDEGATKCDPSDSQSSSFSWAFLTMDTKLTVDFGNGDIETSNISINDGTTLKLENTEFDDIDGDGIDEKIDLAFTYTKR